MFSSLSRQRQQQNTTEVNIAPLIDMVFILLIFFLVTTTFARETGIDIEKPQASSGRQLEDRALRIAVTADAELYVQGQPVTRSELAALVRDELSGNPELTVVIIPDQQLSSGDLVKVMDIAKLAGARNVAIATQRIEQG